MKRVFALILGAICISTAPILVKLSGVEAASLAFYRCFFAFLILAPTVFLYRRNLRSLSGKNFLWISLAAFFFALDLFVWHQSIYLVGAGMATILGNTQALYLSILGALFLSEKLPLRFFIYMGIAFVGVFFLVSPFDSGIVRGPNYFFGVFLGLLTGVFYSGYIFFLRLGQNSITKLPAVFKLALVSGITSLALFPMASMDGDGIELLQSHNWLWTLLLAIIPQVIGWLIITKSLPKIDIGIAGLILLLQPILASLWSFLIFDERLGLLQVFGGALSLSAVYLGSLCKATN